MSVIKAGDSLHPCLHNILLPSPSHFSNTSSSSSRTVRGFPHAWWCTVTLLQLDVQHSVLVCKPKCQGLGLMNAHHSLVFSTRWTNQAQKNERVLVFGSIWLRSSQSHVRQAICGGDGGWQHMGANPVDLGDLGDQTHPIILLPLRPPGGDRSGAPWKIDSISTLWSQFPNNGDPPAGFGASQDVHLFKGRGRGGGPSGVALTVFPNNLRHSEKVFGQLQYQTTINLRKHLQT